MTSRPRAVRLRVGGKGRGAPDSVRSVSCKYRFDEARRSARPLSASVPSGGPVQALPGPGNLRFRKALEVEEGGPLQAKTYPFAFDHADGGRAWSANQVPGPSEYPPRTFTARSHPAATMVAGHAPFPRDEVGELYGRFWSRGWRAVNARALLTLSHRERAGPMRSMGG